MTKTVETYVAPIASKGTHFETIQQHLSCFQALATDVGMSYVNVVHDVGAVMNVLRKNLELSRRIQKHSFGKLSLLKDYFQVSLFV